MTELERLVVESRRLSAGTRYRYRRGVASFLAFAGENPSSWTPSITNAWYVMQLSNGNAPQTARVRLAGLRYASRRLHELHGTPDFARSVEPAANTPPTKRRALTDEEIARLLAVCRGGRPIDLRDAAIVRLGLATGMRRSSLAGVRLGDFGVDSRRSFRYVDIILKGGRRHRVPITEGLLGKIEPWMRWRSRIEVGHDSLLVTLDAREASASLSPLSADGIYRALRRRASKAGVAVTPHVLRTTMISRLRASGTPTRVVAAITGHKVRADGSSAMVENVYFDATTVAHDAARAVDDILRGIP